VEVAPRDITNVPVDAQHTGIQPAEAGEIAAARGALASHARLQRATTQGRSTTRLSVRQRACAERDEGAAGARVYCARPVKEVGRVTPTQQAPVDLAPAKLAAWRGMLRAQASLLHNVDVELVAISGLALRSCEVLLHLDDAPRRRLRLTRLADYWERVLPGATRPVQPAAADGDRA